MDRQNKLNILSSLSDEKLSSALEAIGIDCGPADHYGEGTTGGDGAKLDTWSSLTLPKASGEKLPPIADKAALFAVKPQAGDRVDMLGMVTPGDEEEMLNAGLM